jgi:mRNA interferase RelE/StbE
MGSYKTILKPSIQKDLRGIPKHLVSAIWASVEALSAEPLPRGVEKLTRSQGLYRIRVGDYRIIYSIDHESHIVLVQHIRHRREAYRFR